MKLFIDRDHQFRRACSKHAFVTVYRTTFNLFRRRSRIPRAQDFYLFRTYSSRNKNQSYEGKIGRTYSLFLENFFLSLSPFSFCVRNSKNGTAFRNRTFHLNHFTSRYVYNCSSSRDSHDSCTKKRNLARFLNLTFVCATHFPHLFVYIQKMKFIACCILVTDR